MITTLENKREINNITYNFKHTWDMDESLVVHHSNYLIKAYTEIISLFLKTYKDNPFNFRDKVINYITTEIYYIIGLMNLENTSDSKITSDFYCDTEYLNSSRVFRLNLYSTYKEEKLINYSLTVTKAVTHSLLGPRDCIGTP